jgi:diamine N-acetyltransferase
MNIKIRNATPTDAGEISQLLQTVQNLHATLYPAIFRHVDHAALAEQVTQIISDSALHVRVAILDDVVAGYSMFKVDGCESSDLIHPHRYLFLEQIAVAPIFRRKGIAMALLNDFKIYAAQMGLTEVRLDVWGANAEAQACFEKAGFSTYNYRMTSTVADTGNSKTTDMNE